MEKFKKVPRLKEFTINEISVLTKVQNNNIVKFYEML